MSEGMFRYSTITGMLTATSASPTMKYQRATAAPSEKSFQPKLLISPCIARGLPFDLLVAISHVPALRRSLVLKDMLVQNLTEAFFRNIGLKLTESSHRDLAGLLRDDDRQAVSFFRDADRGAVPCTK